MEIPSNVSKFISICAKEVGKQAQDGFEVDMDNECQEMGMESPIEQLFYITFNYIRCLNSIFFPDQEPSEIILENGLPWCPGLGIYPQRKIGKYRVDFLIKYQNPFRKGLPETNLIVECDSQQFHDRTEPERRKEKARDRFLQSQGYKIFRFTGKEIIDNCPYLAAEVICELSDYEIGDLLIDSNIED